MVDKPRNHCYHRHIGTNRQSVFLLKRRLVLPFSRESAVGIIEFQVLIRFRIVKVSIYAVYYAAELETVLAQDIMKPMRKERRLDFLGVFRADGGYGIGTKYRTLGKVHGSVKFNGRGVHLIKPEEVAHRFPAVYALIFDIVDCIYGFHAGISGAHAVSALEQDYGKCRLPVVCTVDIGEEINHSHEREYRV